MPTSRTDAHATDSSPYIELVIPVFNEVDVIEAHLEQISLATRPDRARCSCRLLLVDDGSTDGTTEALARFCAREPRARWMGFTRNFGKEAAIQAGLDHCEADAVVIMDSDLQHPPELVVEMVRLWRAGAKVVEACKTDRGQESWASRLQAWGFYTLFNRLAGIDLHGQSDFKLLDREVILACRALPERGRFFRGLVAWLHFPTARIPFEVPPRAGGASRWGRIQLLRYALDNLLTFSALPLQLVTWSGVLCLMVGAIFAGLALWQKWHGQALDGFTTVILLQIFFSGTLMLSLGIMGQYLQRIFEEVKQRPLYVLQRPPAAQPENAA